MQKTHTMKNINIYLHISDVCNHSVTKYSPKLSTCQTSQRFSRPAHTSRSVPLQATLALQWRNKRRMRNTHSQHLTMFIFYGKSRTTKYLRNQVYQWSCHLSIGDIVEDFVGPWTIQNSRNERDGNEAQMQYNEYVIKNIVCSICDLW